MRKPWYEASRADDPCDKSTRAVTFGPFMEVLPATPIVYRPNVAAILLDAQDQIFVAERINIKGAWQFPQGGIDEGEDAETALFRELAEEIGMAAGSLERLIDFHHSPGFCDELQHIYLASDLTPVTRCVDGLEEEHMIVRRVPFADAVAMALDGTITDGKSIAGLLAAARRLGR